MLWRCWLGGRKGIRPVKKLEWCGAGVVICLERSADLYIAQLMPLPLIVSCFSKIRIGFTFLVPADPGSPGQRAVKRVCVCTHAYLFSRVWNRWVRSWFESQFCGMSCGTRVWRRLRGCTLVNATSRECLPSWSHFIRWWKPGHRHSKKPLSARWKYTHSCMVTDCSSCW